MTATLTELRNPAVLLKAADAGDVVILTNHGKPEYLLRKIAAEVDWDALVISTMCQGCKSSGSKKLFPLSACDLALSHETSERQILNHD